MRLNPVFEFEQAHTLGCRPHLEAQDVELEVLKEGLPAAKLERSVADRGHLCKGRRAARGGR